MQHFHHINIIKIFVLYLMIIILIACGNSANDQQASSQPTAPTISLLSVSPKEVNFSGTGGDVPITLEMYFEDPTANLSTYTLTTKDAVGNILSTATGIISGASNLAAGNITLKASVPANVTGIYSFTVHVTDSTGLRSNELTKTCTVLISIAENLNIPSSSDTGHPGIPAVSYDGNQYLIVYRRLDDSSNTIRGTFVTKSGSVVKDFHIGPSNVGAGEPAISFDGVNYLVVFSYQGVIRGQRVTPVGNVLDGETGFAISTGTVNYSPAIAFDGTNYLVAWSKSPESKGYDIYATLISPSAEVFGEFVVTDREQWQLSPSIAFDGVNFLIVWHDAVLGSGPPFHIYGTRVNKNGFLIDASPIAIDTAPGSQQYSKIAFDGTNYFVVWTHCDETSPNSFTVYDIRGKRISKEGTIIDGDAASGGIDINTAPYDDKTAHSVIFDGTDYFITWAYANYSSSAGVYGAKVSSAGILQGEPDNLGIPLTGPSPDGCYLFPVMYKTDINLILVWGNFWTSIDSSNSVRGILISDN